MANGDRPRLDPIDPDFADPPLPALPDPQPPPGRRPRGTELARRDGVPGVVMPDGKFIPLTNWCSGTYYSALAFEADPTFGTFEDGQPLGLFTYGPSQRVLGSNRNAYYLHTNIPRSGDSGLPQDWEGLVYGWYADVDHPEVASLWSWIASAYVRLVYNRKHYAQAPLRSLFRWKDELAVAEYLVAMSKRGGPLAGECGVVADALLGGRLPPLVPYHSGSQVRPRTDVSPVPVLATPPTGGLDDAIAPEVLEGHGHDARRPAHRASTAGIPEMPLHLRHNLSYEVVIEQWDHGATERLRAELVQKKIERVLLWVHLDGLWLRTVV